MIKFFLSFLFLLGFYAIPAQNIDAVVQRNAGGKCGDLTISSDGLLLAKIDITIYSSEIEVWNVKTGHLLRVINTNVTGDFNKTLKHVRFWKGSKFIITGTNSGIHEIYNVESGKLVKKLPVISYLDGDFAVCEKTGVFACLDPLAFTKNEILLYDLYSNSIFDTIRLSIENISALEFSQDGNEIAVGTNDGSFHLVVLKIENDERKTRKVLNVHKGPVEYLQWTTDNYLLTSDSSKFTLWDLTKGTLASRDTLETGCRIVTSPTEDCFYKTSKNSISRLSPQLTEQKSMGVQTDDIVKFSLDEQNERMYILTQNFIKLWDMKNISQEQTIKTDQFFSTAFYAKTKEQQMEDFQFVPALRSCMYIKNNRIILSAIDTSFTKHNFSFSGDTAHAIFVSRSNYPVIVLKDKMRSWINDEPVELKTAMEQKILFNFITANQVASVQSKDSVLNIYDFTTGNIKKIPLSGQLNCGALSANKQQFVVAGDHLFLADAQTFQYKELYDTLKENLVIEFESSRSVLRMPGNYRQVIFSADGKKLFTNNLFGQIKIWDLSTLKIDTILNINAGFMQLSLNGGRLFIAVKNEIIWMNAVTYAKEASLAFLQKGDYIISLPDNYYKASNNGAKAIAFRKGLQTSGFDQYDLVYNRPDIVTQKLGNPSKEMLESLGKAVSKRHKKMGITATNDKIDELETPDVVIKNYSSIPTITKKQLLEFTVEARDKKNNLKTLNAFINGVPFLGKKGIDIPGLKKEKNIKEIWLNFPLYLDAGKNLIEVSCTNDKGISSARRSFEIFYNDTIQYKPTLYFIGIGAGIYQNSEYNLKYPSKDVTDVAKIFKQKMDMFGKVQVTLLTNEQVTADRVKQLKKMLKDTKVEDKVIVYWSGHGVLNKEMDYYLATYNMDFLHPEVAGLDYDELENLLDDIPARKRLLFIDACHSGEIDKDEIKFVQTTNTEEGKLTVHNAKGNILLNKKMVSNPTLFNELFTDVRRNSGANIISAAGGAEYALEADSWGYGVFTYCLLKGLQEKKADSNNDGQILISELQTYLQVKVPELTQGRQKPTSRTENLITDWRIW